MSVVSTGLTEAGVRSEFMQRYDAAVTYYQDLATRIVSNKPSEKYRWLGSVPKMRSWGTGRLAKGIRAEAYDVENEKYEATIEVDRDEVDDDQTGAIRVRIGELAIRAASHKDFLISDLLKNGATTGFNSYDGVSFFNDAHASGDSGNQDNKLGAAAVAPTDPTTDEFKKSLKAAIAAMLAWKDDTGDPLSVSATGLVAVVPPTMLFPAAEAINASVISQTTNVMQGIARVIAFPWLTLATTWYLLKTDGVMRPFVFQDRRAVEVKALAEGSSEEFLREKYLYGVSARYAMTYGLPGYAVSTVFA
jgi:phage major head subunit gpT-like protein